MAESPKPILLRIADVQAMLSMSRSQIYAEMNEGRFPKAVKIGPQSVRWRTADIEAWLADRPAAG